MELNRNECIDLLKTLGRKQRQGCEATMVITESEAQSIIKELEASTQVKKGPGRPPKKTGDAFGKTPE